MSRQSNDPNVLALPADGVINNFEANAGLIFYFGR
jgi:hypothetical protein